MASRLIFISALVAILHCTMMGQIVFPFCQGNLYGLVSEKGTIILSPRYDAIELSEHPAQSEVFVVYHQGAYGLVDKTGKEVLPPKFDNMYYHGTGFAWYYNDNSNERGLHVISSRERKEVYHSDSLRLIEILGQGKYFGEIYNGKTGHTSLINESGKIVIPDIHGKVSIEFTDYDCPLIISGSISKPFFFDCNGNPTTYESYLKKSSTSADLQIKEMEVNEGVSDRDVSNNNLLNSPETKIKQEVRENGILVSLIASQNGLYGLLSLHGEVLIPFEHILLDTEYGYIKSITDGYRGIFTNNGQVVLSPKFRDIVFNPNEFYGFFKVYTTSGYCGFADKNGHVFLPLGAMEK